ncbi:helix-turn-helix domain-containing protein [Acidocella sp. KAb 2-4]|uniref:helix-turn-helix domain-containing protein n=1 Tax=Acidocella sp. KAb 2-4 TaxID=2885158 RepID=UPI001D07EF95|nr:helix-turn-helix domain-containing protein [Acidocella sp. KAb 2-4]
MTIDREIAGKPETSIVAGLRRAPHQKPGSRHEGSASGADGDRAADGVEALIAGFAPFAGLDAAARHRLARHAITMRVPRSTIIFEQGEMPNAQAAVLEGVVHLSGVTPGRPRMLVETVTSPDLLLPAAVLEDGPYLLRAQAATECRLLLIPAEALRQLVVANPEAALKVIFCLTRQFRRMTRQVKNLKLRTTTQRLAAYLLSLDARKEGSEFALPCDKGTIAAQLGMTRESLSRAFAALEADAITVLGSKISVRDREALLRHCPLDPLIDEAA